jgi:regulator of replication initiation timing
MYSDHQTQEEEKSRPEGSIRQWVASLKNVRFEEGVGIVGDAVIIEPWLQAKLATLRDQKLLSEMGISIRAAGVGTKGKIDGKDTNVVERITRVRSVDFVTEAGAGGGVLLYEHDKEFDIDVVTIEALKERRPDLVKLIETETRNITLKEAKQMGELEDKIKELETTNASLTTERDGLKTKITGAEKAQRIAEAKSKVDEAISKAELPEVSKVRLAEKFKGVESVEGLTESIKAESDYVNALKEAGKPKDMGGSKPDKDKSHKDLVESFKRLGMTDKQAEEAASVR